MNTLSRAITGILLIVIGMGLIIGSLFLTLFLLIYGIPLFIVGLLIFFNKNEDKIEEIKKKK